MFSDEKTKLSKSTPLELQLPIALGGAKAAEEPEISKSLQNLGAKEPRIPQNYRSGCSSIELF